VTRALDTRNPDLALERAARELTAIYRPRCNAEQFGPAWKDEWIGGYSAPTTGPLAERGPDPGDVR
jgi:hypothetical protein